MTRAPSLTEEVFAEVTEFLQSPMCAAVADQDLAELVLLRWPKIAGYASDVVLEAINQEIHRRHDGRIFG